MHWTDLRCEHVGIETNTVVKYIWIYLGNGEVVIDIWVYLGNGAVVIGGWGGTGAYLHTYGYNGSKSVKICNHGGMSTVQTPAKNCAA